MNVNQYLRRKLFVLRQSTRTKTFVFVLSCMRSGSTLLKSLLAMGPDVSHLPEVDYQRFDGPLAKWKLKALSERRIIVLKKPAPFDFGTYPQLPAVANSKQILLVRDAYETVNSLRQMIQRVYPEQLAYWTPQRLLEAYWVPVNSALLRYHQRSADTFLLRYEELTASPIPTTEKLFSFIGSQQRTGFDHYLPPQNYDWAWGNDDGGEKIKSCQVQAQVSPRDDAQLLRLLTASDSVQQLRQQLGYDRLAQE